MKSNGIKGLTNNTTLYLSHLWDWFSCDTKREPNQYQVKF